MPSMETPTHTRGAWGVGENKRTVVFDYVTPEELNAANGRNSQPREDMDPNFREVRQEVRAASGGNFALFSAAANRVANGDRAMYFYQR